MTPYCIEAKLTYLFAVVGLILLAGYQLFTTLDSPEEPACGRDIRNFCSMHLRDDAAALRCLKKHMQDLDPECRSRITASRDSSVSGCRYDDFVYTRCENMGNLEKWACLANAPSSADLSEECLNQAVAVLAYAHKTCLMEARAAKETCQTVLSDQICSWGVSVGLLGEECRFDHLTSKQGSGRSQTSL